MIFWIISIR